jgi:glycosyltransferase involved in cell wall biosynthesis
MHRLQNNETKAARSAQKKGHGDAIVLEQLRIASYEGFVETDNGTRITGWCVGRTDSGSRVTSQVLIEIGGKQFAVDANEERSDLKQNLGIEFGAFQFAIPKRLQRLPVKALFVNGNEVPRLCSTAVSFGAGSMDEENDSLFQGWATSAGKLFTNVKISANEEVVGTSVASYFRPDLSSETTNGHAGFVWKVPPALRGVGEVELKMEVEDSVIFNEKRHFSPISVLIVSEAEDFSDASRIYRCDNLQVLLQRQGVNAQVIGPTEFHRRSWEHVDIIIFARFGVNSEQLDKIATYKNQYGIKIFYEIDDLVFLPWHTHDLGSVRSGVDVGNEDNLRRNFAARLRLLTLADGAITTTLSIRRKMESMGIPCLMIPNLVRSFDIREAKPTEVAENETLRLLCMAGSPTHYRDFQDIEPTLEKLLTHYEGRIELTLLGRFREDCSLFKLKNVKHIKRVPYRKMLQIIDGHDLCLVPLEQTDFNDAKSCLKFIECGARGVPVLASPTEDYRRVIRQGENGFMAATASEWYRTLEQFVNDKSGLARAGQQAQQEVKRSFALESAEVDVKKFVTEEY